MTQKNIKEVLSRGLCHGCGTCAGMCPVSAIEISLDRRRGIYVPEVNDGLCNDCGLCLKACPGQSVDFRGLNSSIFGREPEDVWLGNYLGLYVGHSSDDQIRYYASSGGADYRTANLCSGGKAHRWRPCDQNEPGQTFRAAGYHCPE